MALPAASLTEWPLWTERASEKSLTATESRADSVDHSYHSVLRGATSQKLIHQHPHHMLVPSTTTRALNGRTTLHTATAWCYAVLSLSAAAVCWFDLPASPRLLILMCIQARPGQSSLPSSFLHTALHRQEQNLLSLFRSYSFRHIHTRPGLTKQPSLPSCGHFPHSPFHFPCLQHHIVASVRFMSAMFHSPSLGPSLSREVRYGSYVSYTYLCRSSAHVAVSSSDQRNGAPCSSGIRSLFAMPVPGAVCFCLQARCRRSTSVGTLMADEGREVVRADGMGRGDDRCLGR
ncbi:hypothetical protein B0T14DRAFT_296478 [Immersiella caudata]|uniref:Uncharacterized protein n=1 Tax=Immersiella caudata TaxID=314043 RepID=A0AA40BUH1_9PEZI|nr:hypothetical protein B0T14DRAFT_296478 [Immersiella caudata]